MGTYAQLDCLDCAQSLSFGKPIQRGDLLTLRLFSESDGDWHAGEICWQALQVFFFDHIGHRLIFRTDDTPEANAFGEAVDFDSLLARWAQGVTSK